MSIPTTYGASGSIVSQSIFDIQEACCLILGTLKTVGLGGGYHTAIEILGMEYHFGGCNRIDSGIFESRPLHQMRRLHYTNESYIS